MTWEGTCNLLRRAIAIWAIMGGILLIVVVLLTMVNVAGFTANSVARLFGGNVSGLPGYEDAVTVLIGVAGLSMFPYCQLTGGHAAVDVLMKSAPRWAQRGMHQGSTLLVAAIALAMAVMLVNGLAEARADGRLTPVLGWPVWIFMIPAAFSCVLWSIAALLTVRSEMPD
ncbi:TRAP transporter small permease [Rhodobacteraceae bacterium NNCM2]|nr:TRAP transporter small permease [Coraliihabitans acroporae]